MRDTMGYGGDENKPNLLDESGIVYEVHVTEELGSTVTLAFGEGRA